ncbi:DUF3105 domain-containing protein [Nocardioides sp. Kera G14]|uniref:DUF3105 domain-containing protein n=1 Tax=Nocardioides sp. Kera G14 TaxID=2884264 RepID=UPI001D12AFEB|nr:DUF3105 domain-containing protein [Nocardioides sp. Kera G14]UDY22341.1 DUF3105 domain-containing protein [Nocardioides sp. Kera G14]
MTEGAALEILGPTPPPRRRRRRGLVIAVTVLAVMLVAGLAAWPMVRPEHTVETLSASYAGIRGVHTYAHLSNAHTDGSVDYPQTPPVGGEHDPVWLACGVYDVPVRDENAVHDLEHGAVWIAYDPDLSRDQVAKLAKELPANGIMAPYPGIPAKVVLTVWGIQLPLSSADDPRIGAFLAKFGHGEAAPESGVSCAGGLKDPNGGHAPEGTSV